MASSLVHEAFHQDEDPEVVAMLKVLETECQKLRPIPAHVRECVAQEDDDLILPSAGFLRELAVSSHEDAADDDVMDDEIMDIARDLDVDCRPLEEWVRSTQGWLNMARSVREECEEVASHCTHQQPFCLQTSRNLYPVQGRGCRKWGGTYFLVSVMTDLLQMSKYRFPVLRSSDCKSVANLGVSGGLHRLIDVQLTPIR